MRTYEHIPHYALQYPDLHKIEVSTRGNTDVEECVKALMEVTMLAVVELRHIRTLLENKEGGT